MSLLEKITQDMKAAMKAGEKEKLSALRMVLANVKNKQIEKKAPLEDDEILRILQGLVRQSKDAVAQFKQGNRSDLVKKEETFISICQAYLPAQLDEENLKALITQTIDEVGAVSPREMGKVMKAVMPKVVGRADGKQVNQIVRAILSKNSP